MRHRGRWSGILTGTSVVALSVQPVWAATTPVTAVRLNPTGSGIEVILETATGDRPQVFTISNGKDTMANLLNAQLNLPGGGNFRQDNPMPGIASVVVRQMDAKSIQVVVSGALSPPKGEILQKGGKGVTLSFSLTTGKEARLPASPPSGIPIITAQTPPSGNQPPASPTSPQPGTQTPTPQPTPTSSPGTQTPTPQPTPTSSPGTQTPTPQPTPSGAKPDVLVPNPEITINGNPAAPASAAQPVAPAPPFLPRAIAPPVGDIAVSNTDASPSAIDLGTGTRVPRLVLRDAPVREVLSLLARSAGLNLAFATGQTGPSGQPVVQGGAAAIGPTISLDIENEPVQDVFNYVLQISGLQANRQGRTVFVGTQLPIAARDIVTRSFRLNQVTASQAAGFLSAQGAETQRVVENVQIQTVGEGAAARTVETRTTNIQPLAATVGTGPLLLRGLSVLTDERLNAVTLVGAPRQIEIASSFLTQLDARKRQVAVNIKIIDVNLLAIDNFNASFSFGSGSTFFVSDGGAAALNFGGYNPPSRTTVTSGTTTPPVITNPYANANVFLDPNRTVSVQGTTPGTTVVNNGQITQQQQGQSGTVAQPYVNLTNPLSPGFTSITQATNNIITTTTSNGTTSTTASVGTNGSVTSALPSLFQYPKRFLSTLQAEIQNQHAKILTDPTLIVQEGQSANVNLTQEVLSNVTTTLNSTNGGAAQLTTTTTKDRVGLSVGIRVERIDDNGFVSLSILPVVRSPGSTSNVSTGNGSSQQITLINERSLNSGLIRLRDGQTLILTGIIQETDQVTTTKTPILGDIPIIGALFRSTNRNNQRQEVIVLLTPQIIDDSSLSTFGYNYSPGSETRQILQRQGFPVQGGNQSPTQ